MKKEKKAKKTNNKDVETGKKKWAVWKTIVSVISAIVAVVGVTVLGVYLAGGFNEKIVNPESISFSYDSSLFNSNNAQLEITEDFSLTIVSPTEGVTENKVTLSFSGNLPVTRDNGYISNTIIQVPEVVTIGQPFQVHLLTELLKDEDGQYILDENNQRIDWIKGGITTLVATSEYNQIGTTRIQIAVDVPVYKTEIEVYNSNNEKTNQVVTGESFTLKSKFIPAKSEFMYSDDSNEAISSENRRVKKSFYEAKNANNAISPVYDGKYDMHFVAGGETVDNITINGYTFKNSKTQLEYESTLVDYGDTDFYNAMVVYLAQNIENNVLSDVSIKIGEASIGNFTVTTQEMSIVANQQTRVYMSRNNYVENSKFLGVNVYSTSGAILEGMLSNIALTFDYQGQDPTQDVNAIITVKGGEYIDIDGKRYYKPNAQVANYNYAYWDILASEEQEIQVSVVLIVNTEDGPALFEISGEDVKYNVNISIVSTEEKPLGWANQADINVMLDYNTDGTIKPQDVSLSYLPEIPEENIYKDTVFFAYFGTGSKEELKAIADSVLGSTGYNYERSGIYSTDTDNLLLFAIEGDRLTLQNTGSFRLYYATYKGVTQEGLYDIALMCSGYVNVVCEKALYSDSVTSGEVDTANFQENSGEVAIDQGSDLTFGIRFIVDVESVPVFEDEYNKGYMSLIIRDNQNNDITSNFLIDSENFTIDGETDQGILEYRLKVNEAVAINNDNGIYLGQMALQYNDTQSKDITWTFRFPEDKNICIYSPKAQSILISGGGDYIYGPVINGTETINVSQSLKESGEFQTNLQFTINGEIKEFNDIESLIKALLGENKEYVVITDQKQRADTLSGQWSFAVKSGNSNIINISADGQSFSFRDANMEEIELYLQSNDKNSSTINDEQVGQYIKLVVNSTGITGMRVNKTQSTYDNTISTGEGSLITDVSKAELNKYGAKGNGNQFIVLNELIKFYIGNDEYTKFYFTFSTQYIMGSSLNDTQITDMFGREGMLSLYTGDSDADLITFNGDYSANNIRNTLISAKIYKIKINKNFASNQTLQFSISDDSGAVNTSLNFNILSNITVSTENYPNNGETIYASSEVIIKNTVTNNNEGATNGFQSLYDTGTYYIIQNGGSPEKFDDDNIPSEYIAIFEVSGSDCFVKFSDFWDQETLNFTIDFRPEGNNSFALSQKITFVVNRDLKIESNNGTFYILGNSTESLEEFVSVNRYTEGDVDGNTYPTALEFTFADYLTYSDGNVRKQDVDFFFDYNVTELTTNLYVKLPGTANEDALATINVSIKLTDDLYQSVARLFTMKDVENSPTATTQIIGDTEYLVLNRMDDNFSWKIGNLGSSDVVPSMQDYNGNSISCYTINGSGENLTVILNKQSSLLAGLNDSSMYMAVNFTALGSGENKVLATAHIPLIISSIGYQPVVYDSDQVQENRILETALTKPEDLLPREADEEEGIIAFDGIYNEITAGQLSNILTEYTFGEELTQGGLYTLKGFNQQIKFYPIESSLVLSTQDLIKNISIDKDENNSSYGTITLNHLASDDYYLALEYTLLSSDDLSQTFYYLLKVVPDVEIEDTLYAYNGTTEHLIIDVNTQGQVDLDKTYGDTTLHSGYKRFNVSKNLNLIKDVNNLIINTESDKVSIEFSYKIGTVDYTSELIINNNSAIFDVDVTDKEDNEIFDNFDGNFDLGKFAREVDAESVMPESINIMIKEGKANLYYGEKENLIFSSLNFVNEIESVTIESETFYNNEWSGYVDLSFSSDYSTFYYTPKTSSSITVVIKHSYQGGNLSDEFSVVGGVQYYTFVINDDTTNYTIRFKEESSDSKVTDNYSWTINNSDGSSDETKTKTMQIDLISNSSGSSQTGTVVRNKANVVLTNGESGEDKDIASYNYNTATGLFELTLNPYIDSDRTIEFAVYTELGYLATLSVHLKANASYTSKLSELNGGKDYAFGELFTITLNGNEPTLTVDAQFSGEGSKFIKWNEDTQTISIADLLEDHNLTIDFTLTFSDDQDESINGKQFKFSYSYKLKANIIKKTNVTSDDLTIAGKEHTIIVENLYGLSEESISIREDTKITLEPSSSSPAFAGLKNNIVSTNFVSTRGTVDIDLIVSFKFEGEEGAVEQTYVVRYSFTVYPSVEISTNYPKPTQDYNEEREYVENETTFNNVLNDFFMHNPVFAGENLEGDTNSKSRIYIKEAEKTDNQISYNNHKTDPTVGNISIIVSKLSNATVSYKVTGNDVVYPEINSSIPVNASITFIRGNSGKITSLAKIQMLGSIEESLYGDYYLVFKNNSLYKVSNIVDFDKEDLGKELNLDLGVNVEGYELFGVYSVKDISENKNLTLKDGRLTGSSEDIVVENELNSLSNVKEKLFNSISCTTSGFTDNGQDSIVTFTLIYQEVSMTYTVYILNNALSVRVNNVSNNTSSGEFGGSTVGYEKIYVDATSTKDLFAEYRMANVQMSSSMQSYANQYYLVFKNTANTTYMASYPIYFKADDQGKKLNIDLGISMKDLDFVGAYLTSEFNGDNKLKIQDNKITTDPDVNIEEELNKIGNSKNDLFEQGTITLINRIQLIYGNNIVVDYDYFSDNLTANYPQEDEKSFDIDIIEEGKLKYGIDDIAEIKPLASYTKNDGSIDDDNTVEFVAKYYFMPTIDIDVDAQITQAGFLTNLEVNKEYDSVVELFGIRHPTNNRLLSSSEFTSSNISLNMKILEYSKDASSIDDSKVKDILNKYFDEYDFTKFTNIAPNKNTEQYLSFSKKDNIIDENTKYTYDYTLLPLGAKNQGDYELIKFTYTNSGFTKEFYVVVKIMPDYSVKYGGSEGNAKDEGTYVSNIDSKYIISAMLPDSENKVYSQFTLLGENGHLSIKHTNGDNTNSELSTMFSLKLSFNENIDSVVFNNDTNISQKLLSSKNNISNLFNQDWLLYKSDDVSEKLLDKGEKPDLSGYKYLSLENNKDTLTFTNIPIVIFGTQYYMIEGRDNYNYTFRLYFCLQPPQGYTTPSSTQETIRLTELEYFDIGAQYELLEIQKTSEKEEDNNIHIVSNPRTPSTTDNVKLVELQGIKAWAFAYDYTAEDEEKQFLIDNANGGYDIITDDSNPKYIMSSSDKEYLNIKNLMLKYITVENINFYDPSNPTIALTAELTPNSSDSSATAEERNGYHLATARAGLQGFYNGMSENELRGVYTNPENQSSTTQVGEDDKQTELYKPFQVPRFTNTDIFANSNTANVTMVITLKYDDGNTIEYYDCPINVELTREITITEKEVSLVDGTGKSVESVFDVTSAGVKDETIQNSYLNDTIEVIVNKNSSATFEMTLERSGSIISSASVTVSNTGTNFNKTYYISLSQYFEMNVKQNDIVTIKEKTDGSYYNASFYYITGNAETVFKYFPDSKSTENNITNIDGDKANRFKIDLIQSDVVYIDDASMLNPNMYYTTTKYYIINVNIGGKDYTYRKSKLYYVTGKYYKLSRDYETEIAYELNKPNGESNLTTGISGWFNESQTYPIYLQQAHIEKGIISATGRESGSPDYLKFSIDPIDGASGKASIADNGTITINKEFGEDEYIKVNIYMEVSGNDRDIEKDEDTTYILLGSVRLGLAR